MKLLVPTLNAEPKDLHLHIVRADWAHICEVAQRYQAELGRGLLFARIVGDRYTLGYWPLAETTDEDVRLSGGTTGAETAEIMDRMRTYDRNREIPLLVAESPALPGTFSFFMVDFKSRPA